MNATELLTKLQDMGLPADIVSKISEKIDSGVDVMGQLQSQGLEGMLSGMGVDLSALKNIDMSSFGAVSELFGHDADGDGVTGVSEVANSIKDTISSSVTEKLPESTGGILDMIKGFFK